MKNGDRLGPNSRLPLSPSCSKADVGIDHCPSVSPLRSEAIWAAGSVVKVNVTSPTSGSVSVSHQSSLRVSSMLWPWFHAPNSYGPVHMTPVPAEPKAGPACSAKACETTAKDGRAK